MWSLSFLSSLIAVLWALVKLGLGGWEDLSTWLTSALSSSASCWLSLVQAASMAVMYSKLGGCFGETAKLGPLARTDLCAKVKGLLERLITHFGLGSSLREEPWGLLCLSGGGEGLASHGASAASPLGNTGLGSAQLGGLTIWLRDSAVSQGCVTCLGTAWLILPTLLFWEACEALSLAESPYCWGCLGFDCLGDITLCLGESTIYQGSLETSALCLEESTVCQGRWGVACHGKLSSLTGKQHCLLGKPGR